MPSDEYNHVKTLIRELHGPAKNVSRPPPPSSSSLSSLQIDTRDHPNTAANNEFDVGSSEENTSLLGPRQQAISIIATAGGHATSEHLLQQTSSDDNNDLSMSKQKFHHYSNNSLSLPIPSLIVTGVDQPDHPYNNNQRRFSQFYFGLRRFSNSHTVLYTIFFFF